MASRCVGPGCAGSRPVRGPRARRVPWARPELELSVDRRCPPHGVCPRSTGGSGGWRSIRPTFAVEAAWIWRQDDRSLRLGLRGGVREVWSYDVRDLDDSLYAFASNGTTNWNSGSSAPMSWASSSTPSPCLCLGIWCKNSSSRWTVGGNSVTDEVRQVVGRRPRGHRDAQPGRHRGGKVARQRPA